MPRCWRFKKPMAIAWWQRTAWQKFANCFWTAWQLWRLSLFVELVTLETALNPRVHLAFGNASTPHWIAYNVMCFQQFEVNEAALNIMQSGQYPQHIVEEEQVFPLLFFLLLLPSSPFCSHPSFHCKQCCGAPPGLAWTSKLNNIWTSSHLA